MGTRFELLLPAGEVPQPAAVAARVEREVSWWEARLSRFREESDLSRINREGYDHPVAVDPRVFSLLEECARWHATTHGLFDPAVLPLLRYHEVHSVPDAAAAAALARRHGWREVVLDAAAHSVALASPEAGLDAGAFGKGLALRVTRRLLREAGVAHALVSFGESSLLTLGHHPHGDHWPVSLPHLFEPLAQVYRFRLGDGALSVSGASRQRRPRGRKGYLHIIDPRSGMPVTGWKQTAVQHPNPLAAEVLSTAFLIAQNREEEESLLENFPGTFVVKVEYLNEKPNIVTFGSPNRRDDG